MGIGARPARAALARGDLGGLDVLLAHGELDAAWQTAVDHPDTDFGEQPWIRLAEAREQSHSADAFAVYLRITDIELETTGRGAYTRTARILGRAERAAAPPNARTPSPNTCADSAITTGVARL